MTLAALTNDELRQSLATITPSMRKQEIRRCHERMRANVTSGTSLNHYRERIEILNEYQDDDSMMLRHADGTPYMHIFDYMRSRGNR